MWLTISDTSEQEFLVKPCTNLATFQLTAAFSAAEGLKLLEYATCTAYTAFNRPFTASRMYS